MDVVSGLFLLIFFIGFFLPISVVIIDQVGGALQDIHVSFLKNKFLQIISNYAPLVVIGVFVLSLILNEIRRRRYEQVVWEG